MSGDGVQGWLDAVVSAMSSSILAGPPWWTIIETLVAICALGVAFHESPTSPPDDRAE